MTADRPATGPEPQQRDNIRAMQGTEEPCPDPGCGGTNIYHFAEDGTVGIEHRERATGEDAAPRTLPDDVRREVRVARAWQRVQGMAQPPGRDYCRRLIEELEREGLTLNIIEAEAAQGAAARPLDPEEYTGYGLPPYRGAQGAAAPPEIGLLIDALAHDHRVNAGCFPSCPAHYTRAAQGAAAPPLDSSLTRYLDDLAAQGAAAPPDLDVERLAEAMMEALTPGYRSGPGSKGYKKLHRQRAERIVAEYARLSGAPTDSTEERT